MRSLIAAHGLLALLTLPIGAQVSPAPSPPGVELPPEFARVLTDYERAYRQGGRELAALFAEDGFVLPSRRPPIRGRAAIAQFYGAGRGPLALRAIAFGMSDSLGYIVGGYAEHPGDPDGGKFTLVLQKAPNGQWRIFSDMDNTNLPPPPPNLTGVWSLDPSESRMVGGPLPRGISWTWTIDHSEPDISVTVDVEDDQGPRQFSFTCTNDGRECTNELPMETRRSTAIWEGSVLVMRTEAVTQHGRFEAVDRIQMMDNRQTLVMDRVLNDSRGEQRVKQVFRRVS